MIIFQMRDFAYMNIYFLFFKYFLLDVNKYLTKQRDQLESIKGSVRRAPL